MNSFVNSKDRRKEDNMSMFKFFDAPKKGTEFYVSSDDGKLKVTAVWEVLEGIDDSPSKYWLVIDTKGELDLIYRFHNEFYQSIYFKERW
jgi:hypothetical protein